MEIIRQLVRKILSEGIQVYHGSDNNFDSFDMDKIGTGDGRSLGGWGLYFSESPDVSKQYITRKGSVKSYDIRNGDYFDLDANLDEYEAGKIVGMLRKRDVDESELQQFETDFIAYADSVTNRQVYEWLSHVLGNQKNASLFLKDAGYMGNIFSDKTNPNVKNYVLFDGQHAKPSAYGNDNSDFQEGGEG